MKFLRSVAYAFVALCVALCLIILFYKGKGTSFNAPLTITSTLASTDPFVEVKGDEVSAEEVKDAANAIISDAVSTVKDAISGLTNKVGEVSYEDIVKLQNEALDEDFRKALEEYYKENGITIPKPEKPSTGTSTSPKMNYVVNKSNKIIHRIGCLLEPSEKNAAYYETLTKAQEAGYKDKCIVCSP